MEFPESRVYRYMGVLTSDSTWLFTVGNKLESREEVRSVPALYAGQLMDRGAQSNIKTNSQPRDISHCHDIFSRKREADVYYKSFLMRYFFFMAFKY